MGKRSGTKVGGEPLGYLLAPVASNPEMTSSIPFCCEMLVAAASSSSPQPLPSCPLGPLAASGESPSQKGSRTGKGKAACAPRLHAVEVQTGEGKEDRSPWLPSLPFGSKYKCSFPGCEQDRRKYLERVESFRVKVLG